MISIVFYIIKLPIIFFMLRIWIKVLYITDFFFFFSATTSAYKIYVTFCWKVKFLNSIIRFPEALVHDLHNVMVQRKRHRENCQLFGHW